jgi:putative DNA primase/helicase
MYPDEALILAADDDHCTEGNPGRTAAAGAAKAVGGIVVVPMFPADRPDKATDFNDLHQMPNGGLDAVKVSFASAIESIAVGRTDPEPKQTVVKEVAATTEANDTTPNTVALSPDVVAIFNASPPPKTEQETGLISDKSQSIFPSFDERPCYRIFDDWENDSTVNHRPGVYWCGVKVNKKGDIEGVFNDWVCSPLHIDAVTFDGQSNNFGRMLRFKPTVGKWREWAMPMELLAGDGTQLRGELLAMGVVVT